MEWLERLKRKLADKRWVQNRSWDEDGLHAVEGELSTHIAWSEVRRVDTYKKDCFTVDQIRLIFFSDHNAIEFTEDDPAFTELCDAVSRKLGVPDDWRLRLVLSPAFEATPTTLYPRSPTESLL
jgi:hypothetical protein